MEKTITLFCGFGIYWKITRRFLYSVNGQLLIGFKSVTHHDLVTLFDANKRIGIDAPRQLIPVQKGSFKPIASQIDELHILAKFPHLTAGIVFGSVTRDHRFGPQTVVELFKINFFRVIPIRFGCLVINFPDLGSHPVTNHTGIGNEHCYGIRKHARNGSAVLELADVLRLVGVAGYRHQYQGCHTQDANQIPDTMETAVHARVSS